MNLSLKGKQRGHDNAMQSRDAQITVMGERQDQGVAMERRIGSHVNTDNFYFYKIVSFKSINLLA